MYVDVKRWDQTVRMVMPYDTATYTGNEIPEGTFCKMDTDGEVIPLADADLPYADTAKYAGLVYLVFKGTEEQYVRDVGKVDTVTPPALVVTDNWDQSDGNIDEGTNLTLLWDATKAAAELAIPTGSSKAICVVTKMLDDNKIEIKFFDTILAAG